MDQRTKIVAQLRMQLTKYEFLGLFAGGTTNEQDRAILRQLERRALAEMGAMIARSLQETSVQETTNKHRS